MNFTEQRLEQAEQKMMEPRFRESKGLANEAKYYVFDYPAKDEMLVRSKVVEIQENFRKRNDEYQIKIFDLYEIIIEILKEKGYLEKCFDMEKRRGFDRIIAAINNMLRITSADSLIIKHIKNNTPDKSIVFITGVGKCFPILRSHIILNNLHQVIDNVPVVMFYPGEYNGQELDLFSEIKDGNYYRAFSLV